MALFSVYEKKSRDHSKLSRRRNVMPSTEYHTPWWFMVYVGKGVRELRIAGGGVRRGHWRGKIQMHNHGVFVGQRPITPLPPCRRHNFLLRAEQKEQPEQPHQKNNPQTCT